MPRPFQTAIAALCLGLGLALSSGAALAGTVTVFAASSLKNVLEEVADSWEAETGQGAVLSFAGSSTLARQIQAGAPADLFVSANTAWLDLLERDGLIRPGSRADLLGNTLVVVASDPAAPPLDPGDPRSLTETLGDGRLAMALVDAVPAGIYGKAALQSLGWWEGLAPRVAQTDNVRAALALVAAGEAPLGIVYATDARAEPRVTIIGTFPEASHPPIRYPVAITAESRSDAAEPFREFLFSPAAAAIFRAHGFAPLPGAGG